MKSRQRSEKRSQRFSEGLQYRALKPLDSTTNLTAPYRANTKSEVTGVKPIKADRKKFDLDLAYGTVREDKVAEMLQDKKIEVKSEKDLWQKTGNICVEYQSWGKPSGIEATESDYWFHNLCIGDDEYCTLVFKTDTLKKIVSKLDTFRTVSGGDHNASRMYLVNLQKLFSTDVIKAYKDIDDE